MSAKTEHVLRVEGIFERVWMVQKIMAKKGEVESMPLRLLVVRASFLFFKKYPKLLPGSKIFVPEKPETTVKAGVADVVGYTTSLVSIIALLKSL